MSTYIYLVFLLILVFLLVTNESGTSGTIAAIGNQLTSQISTLQGKAPTAK